MCCLVDCCEEIDEECVENIQLGCEFIQVEFWHLFGSYISDAKFFVGNYMDARDERHSTDNCMHYLNIRN